MNSVNLCSNVLRGDFLPEQMKSLHSAKAMTCLLKWFDRFQRNGHPLQL